MSKPVTNLDFQKTTLRLPKTLHQELSDLAEKNGTSMNTEILVRLLQKPLEDRIDAVERKTEDLRKISREILEAVRNLK